MKLILLHFFIFFSYSLLAQIPSWVNTIGSTNVDYSYSVDEDTFGNVYLTGWFSGTADFDPGPSVFNLTSAGSTDVFVSKYTSTGQFLWAFKVGQSNRDGGMRVKVNNAGEVLVTGFVRDNNIDFDPGPAIFLLNAPGTAGTDPGHSGDIFLAKYTPGGQFVWAFVISGQYNSDIGEAIEVDNNDNIYLTGAINATSTTVADADPGPGVYNLAGQGKGHAFVAKYTTNSNFIWAFQLGTYGLNSSVKRIEMIPNDTTFVICGHHISTNADFDPGPGIFTLNGNGGEDMFTGRYSINGSFVWALSVGGSNQDLGMELHLDGSNNVYTSGSFSGVNIDFNPSIAINALNSSGGSDGYLVKYSSNGQYLWAFGLGSALNEYMWTFDIVNNKIISGGEFRNTVDFDPSVAVFNLTSNGLTDAYMATYDTSGNFLCASSIGGQGEDRIFSIKAVAIDSFYVCGSYLSNNIDFDPSPSVLVKTNAGNYDAFIGKYYSQNAQIIVNGSVTNDTICAGQNPNITIDFTPNILGLHPATISDGVNIYTVSNVSDNIPFTFNALPLVTTNYTITINSSVNNGCNSSSFTISQPFSVIVNPSPSIQGTANPTSICLGGSTTLTGSGANTYSWSGGVTNGVLFTPSTTATYTVTGTDINGCSNTATVIVTVNPLPNVGGLANPANICPGNTTMLTGSGASTYTWTNGVTNGIAFVPIATTTYTVTGTDVNGCINTFTTTVVLNSLPNVQANATPQTICQGNSTTLTGSGASTYLWSGGVVNGTAFVPASTANYTVTGTDINGCTSTASILITLNPQPNVQASAYPTSVCPGSSTVFTASGANTYSWSGGVTNGVPFIPSTTATYTVTGTDINGCTNTATVIVTVNPLPNVGAVANPANICPGNTTILTGSGASTYTWTNGVTNGVAFAPSATASYTVTGVDANGCSNTSSVTVSVNQNLTINVTPPTSILCLGDSVQLTANGALTYNWSIQPGLSAYTGASVFAYPTATTTYTVTGSDASGCSGITAVTIDVIDEIDITISKNRDAECNINTVQLQVIGAQNYTWTPANLLSNPTGSLTNATVAQTTTFYVTGTTGSCTDMDSIVVYHYNNDEASIFIPSAFSPNNDGNNDCLHVRHKANFSTYYFAIYNRWGERVFETDSPDQCWNGEFKNKRSESATYFYYLKAETSCGKIFKQGDITVIR